MSDAAAQLAVDATFAAFGRAATYRPPGGGTPVACRVIRSRADRMLGALGQGRPFAQGDTIEVRAAEIAEPQRGGTFRVDGDSADVAIASDPRVGDADPERLVWLCTVSE